MPGIRITGMASGLPPNIVDQIMDAERIPLKQLESKKTAQDDKYKLVEEFEGKINEIPKNLSELINTRGFSSMKLSTSDANVLNGVVDPNEATAGSWNIEVVQLAQKSGAVSTGFPDADRTQLGVGYIKFETPEGTKEVYISGQNNTMKGVVAAINSSNTGLKASIINDKKNPENPYRIMVTGVSTGSEKQISFPDVYMLDGDLDFSFENSRAAQNAIVKIDGFEVELADNQAKDLIPGVTVDLKQAAPGKTVSVSIKEDVDVISGKIKSFVDAYNGALTWIQNQHKLQKGKDGREHLGPLGGDGMLRTIESDFRRLIMTPQYGIDGKINQVGQLGIEFNRNGTLNFSQEKFNKAVSNDPHSVHVFFRGDGYATGFVPAVKKTVSNVTNPNAGPLGMRKGTIRANIKDMDNRIEHKNKALEKKEDQLKQKFADLESKMSKINQQGASIAGIGR
jgi:flagellar hook-associated protein 2